MAAIWTSFAESLTLFDMMFLIPSLVLLLIGFGNWGKWVRLERAVGTAVFGLYWATQIPVYLGESSPDVVNGVMCLFGAIFFGFISYHLVRDHLWEEDTKSLAWVVRVSALTATAYFLFYHVQLTQGVLIYIVTWLTYWTLRLFGHSVSIQAGIPTGFDEGLYIWSADPGDVQIRIVFACTAALALLLFISAVLATRVNRGEWLPWARSELGRLRGSPKLMNRLRRNGILNMMKLSDRERKLRAILIVLPIIFVTNVFRNVGVIAGVYGGYVDFDIAHNLVAKSMSLVMMMFLTWVLFEHLPELQEDVMGIFDLTKRVRKGMIVDGRLEMKYIKRIHKKEEMG